MSRRMRQPSSRRPPSASASQVNPYQSTTIPIGNGYHQTPHYQDYARQSTACRNGCLKPTTTIDIGYSDETTDTQSYFDYYQDNGFQHSPLKESRNTDCTFSDDSGSTRLPYYDFDDETNKRYSRNAFSERSLRKPHTGHPKDHRKVYPNQDTGWDRLYQEIPSPVESVPVTGVRRQPLSRTSDRPQSSLSSGITNAGVYGCGGKCQTFENVCYFFLQLVFSMGILIGVSLCIAGVVLRESAARKLQVLVYIGVLLALVSALLLSIQCNARNTAKKRKTAIQNAKRAPIPMDTLQTRAVVQVQHEPLMVVSDGAKHTHRIVQLPQVHTLRSSGPEPGSSFEEQGIPWWRRRDLNPR
ncbi:uncharacterized protein LOC109594680 [Aethina tumida]|uniref:uncharacterized protein LOC109594680 n=1 Tax=Aethina tumida TaxID=116153 RepID=UPI00214932B2|nr:uncharacterized protein LOC109594680 [Aethina tumida]XP_049818493.1 uncharacterized protein LOC109594680 [Aethina tumida]XP_049818500.1 uncharacterized protein LOC109594680 [Aethina tumida]XP_049818504.1 uncharacterized protein LOC109594680 [Aethina tumida]